MSDTKQGDRAKVWIVEPVEYGAYGIMGVYDSLEAAKASIHWCEWERALQHDGWYTVGADSLSSGYHAYEDEVRTLADTSKSQEQVSPHETPANHGGKSV